MRIAQGRKSRRARAVPPRVRVNPDLFRCVRSMRGLWEEPAVEDGRWRRARMMRELRFYGQQRAVVVAPDGRVLGEGKIYRAARALGWRRIAAVEYAGGGR